MWPANPWGSFQNRLTHISLAHLENRLGRLGRATLHFLCVIGEDVKIQFIAFPFLCFLLTCVYQLIWSGWVWGKRKVGRYHAV